jgi:hypothetical protein
MARIGNSQRMVVPDDPAELIFDMASWWKLPASLQQWR